MKELEPDIYDYTDEPIEIRVLADRIHLQFCPHDHIEHCGYVYQPWDRVAINSGFVSKFFEFEKAKNLVALLGSLKLAYDVLNIMRDV